MRVASKARPLARQLGRFYSGGSGAPTRGNAPNGLFAVSERPRRRREVVEVRRGEGGGPLEFDRVGGAADDDGRRRRVCPDRH